MIKIGIAKRLDLEGREHPWRVVVDQDGRRYQMLIALPTDRPYINEPVDPVFGDLTAGEGPDYARSTLKSLLGQQRLLVHERNRGSSLLEGFQCVYMNAPTNDNVDQAIDEIECLERRYV